MSAPPDAASYCHPSPWLRHAEAVHWHSAWLWRIQFLSSHFLENTMATSSLLGVDTENTLPAHNATGIDSLGPSDTSDTGSDSAGAYGNEADSDTDRFGTGERGGVQPSEDPVARDILPDHVENMTTAEPDEGTPSPGAARRTR